MKEKVVISSITKLAVPVVSFVDDTLHHRKDS
jgi:hypothetical protein